MQQGRTTPGEPAIERIFAFKGTVGERILEEIAHPTAQPMRHKRVFGTMWVRKWGADGHEACRGIVVVGTTRIPLMLEKGMAVADEPRTLVIQQVPGCRHSLKPAVNGSRATILEVGSELNENRLKGFACQVVAAFVIHGFCWKDRNGKELQEPYGDRVDPVAKARRKAKKKAKQPQKPDSYDRYLGIW
ncbi:MAG: hypothetical protein A3A43_02945 [Candidatus Liptonbacteria bacterium RIFCSPLOWO2_01_FULL_56_20]|uniref:Uncharacterized protein n=1 Tax=Candidatus Liptonbacteria bacterium RIFCSPLOWO2_01_FULL_56_20 TaxID=1798652 RepID=A0A1G2CK16_9BACT|nr:MAG: hypothetical protein A2681_00075 [Candidatus Liptonbacteria bacterium RIFCSPHIGHO2_01_FULL_56_18b]OGZ01001.1 MAG: hypothetical protein A3A43_02945 [Candidatus Liptonbacteria bacterium RIFCSPLOWO2_01_FULL_56_20]